MLELARTDALFLKDDDPPVARPSEVSARPGPASDSSTAFDAPPAVENRDFLEGAAALEAAAGCGDGDGAKAATEPARVPDGAS